MNYRVAYIGEPHKSFQEQGWPKEFLISKSYDYFFVESDRGWGLVSTRQPQFAPFYLNFMEGSYLNILKKGVRKKDPLSRAIGKNKKKFRVLDLTAGWLRDAWMILNMGCEVTCCEKNTIVYTFLLCSLERQGKEVQGLLDNLNLINIDASQYLQTQDLNKWDVVFIDPMFPENKKAALAGKEMQLLQELIEDSDKGEDLVKTALDLGAPKVVVKRPLKAPEILPGVKYCSLGKSTRFDVYLN